MIQRSTLLHLRIPFSFFLLPVFLFALALSGTVSPLQTFLVFFVIHFLLYPASNGFNSFYDKDEQSIGGLKSPPPVTSQLLYVSLALDLTAILMGLIISIEFSVMIFIYGMVSKAYSHPAIRLKKYPITGLLVVCFFQGFFAFLFSTVGLTSFPLQKVLTPEVIIAGSLTSLLLMGSYPMTQIYQHDEDSKRGDVTISYHLGVIGTFHFTAVVFTIAVIGYFLFINHQFGIRAALVFIMVLLPVLWFFISWYLKVRKDLGAADFSNTMKLNLISSLALNFYFLGIRLFL